MRRTTITLCTLLAVASITVVVVWAQNAHYTKGPKVVDNGLQATATGTISGLGNGNVIVTLSFPNATGTTTCTNQGGTQAAGQNPAAPADVTGSAFIPKVKNGTVSFTVTTAVPPNPTAAEAKCPNDKTWTAAFNDITFGSGTLTIQQDDGTGNFVTVLTTSVSLP